MDGNLALDLQKHLLSNGGIRVALLSIGVILSISLSVVSVAAEGNVLRGFDAPVSYKNTTKAGLDYWPIGIAFDGTNLWISQPASGTSAAIFRITTTGVLLQTLSAIPNAGALAWDGTNLWVGTFSPTTCTSPTSGCSLVFQVSPKTGAVLKTLDISGIFAADHLGGCNVIDGLDFDQATGTLWVSPDPGCNILFTNSICSIGFAYNIDTSGKLLARIQTPFGVSGVAVVGKDLYVVHRCSSSSQSDVSIIRMTTKGRIISSFPIVKLQSGMWAEDIAFDPASFAPFCALWSMQPYPPLLTAADIVAYSIACS